MVGVEYSSCLGHELGGGGGWVVIWHLSMCHCCGLLGSTGGVSWWWSLLWVYVGFVFVELCLFDLWLG